MIIGITGGSGAGKSYVSAVFEAKGFSIVDADKIAKEIMDSDTELIKKIGETFGERFIMSNGKVDRRALGREIYGDQAKIKVLNGLTHPKIISEIRRQALLFQNTVIDIPLLVGSSIEEICDLKIAVTADKETRINRIIARDGIDRKTAEARIASQLSDKEYAEATDEVICNNGNGDEIVKQIENILMRYCK